MNFKPDISEVKEKYLLLDCISGSRAYGLSTAESDIDHRGVFILPKPIFYSLLQVPQVADNKNDSIYYELNRFLELALQNNPTIMELLAMPTATVLYRHPIMERLNPAIFLSKKCRYTFGEYAFAQLRKAKGLNKKINNPQAVARKTPLDFCYVVYDQGSVPLQTYLRFKNIPQENCGLSSIPHMANMFGLYYEPGANFKGIIASEKSNDINLSSIPKEMRPIGIMHFNKNGYSQYCREYREYWDWVKNRNEARYQKTLEHGKNYDTKNLMHTFRLLNMASEIATKGEIIVQRPERSQLMAIRNGDFEYDELIKEAYAKYEALDALYAASKLPDQPDHKAVNTLAFEMRDFLYKAGYPTSY